MASDEFSIIARYFSDIGKGSHPITLGIGDDAAVVDIPADRQLALSIDTLIAGVHFPTETHPADIAYKALAVNLSDLAAMAADPAWFLLSITLPQIDEQWLQQFSAGLREAATQFGLPLIGGDTCRGQLAITIQIAGTTPKDQFVTRAGARTGDLILVSGELGNAALGLAQMRGEFDLPPALQRKCEQALRRPRPRLPRSNRRRYGSCRTDSGSHRRRR